MSITYRKVHISDEEVIHGPSNFTVSARYDVLLDGVVVGQVDKLWRMWLSFTKPGIVDEVAWAATGDLDFVTQTRKRAGAVVVNRAAQALA